MSGKPLKLQSVDDAIPYVAHSCSTPLEGRHKKQLEKDVEMGILQKVHANGCSC